jgi:polyisoprenoid-binding protein YceI
MTGPLTIAGQSRDVTINGTAVRENGRLRVTGSKQLTMTEFGVQPPRLMAGTMRVHAPVTIGFDVVLGQ